MSEVSVSVAEKVTSVEAIRRYFEGSGGRKVEFSEFKALGGDGLREMGELCAKELGLTLVRAP